MASHVSPKTSILLPSIANLLLNLNVNCEKITTQVLAADPITLTMWHMFFSGTLAFICVRGGYVNSINMSSETYLRAVVPIGALFAGKAFATPKQC